LGLLPVSTMIADALLFSQPYNPDWPCGVLLVWPDHVEVRWVHHISDVSPRPARAGYTFLVPPEKIAWAERQVRDIRPDNPGAAWAVHIRQQSKERQQIHLEIWKDGFTGIVYEATPDRVIPITTRHAGPLSPLFVLYSDALLWLALWGLAWLIKRSLAKRKPLRCTARLI
jgi:hypothetical protein